MGTNLRRRSIGRVRQQLDAIRGSELREALALLSGVGSPTDRAQQVLEDIFPPRVSLSVGLLLLLIANP